MFMLPEQSRVKLKMQPANTWGWNELLLNRMSYLLEVLTWQNTEDAAQGRTEKAPMPFTPPFYNDIPKQSLDPDQQTMDIDDLKAFLERPRS
jgi:hypothetical protein